MPNNVLALGSLLSLSAHWHSTLLSVGHHEQVTHERVLWLCAAALPGVSTCPSQHQPTVLESQYSKHDFHCDMETVNLLPARL